MSSTVHVWRSASVLMLLCSYPPAILTPLIHLLSEPWRQRAPGCTDCSAERPSRCSRRKAFKTVERDFYYRHGSLNRRKKKNPSRFKSCLLPADCPQKLTVAELCLKSPPPAVISPQVLLQQWCDFSARLRGEPRHEISYVWMSQRGVKESDVLLWRASRPCCFWTAATPCQHPLRERCVKRYICPECVGRWCHRVPLPFCLLSPRLPPREASRCIFYWRNTGTSGQC